MTVFEFTFGLIAIVLGLALGDLASSLHRLVMNRDHVRWHPLPLLAALLSLWAVVLQWWTAWQDRRGAETTFTGLVLSLFQALVIYLMAAASLPDKGDEGAVDLGAYYDGVRPYYAGLATVWVLAAGLIPSAGALARHDDALKSLIADGVVIGLLVVCIFVRRRWVNTAILGGLCLVLAVRWGVTEVHG